MRIGIDARWILPEGAGISVYTTELLEHIASMDAENEYVLFFDNPRCLELVGRRIGLDEHGNFSTRLLDCGPFSPRGQLTLPARLRKEGLALFHSTNYMFPLLMAPRARRGVPCCIVNIHDVIPLLFPRHAPRSKKSMLFPVYKLVMREIGRRADFIVTGSNSARADIIRTLGIPAARAEAVVAIPDAVASRFRPAKPRPARPADLPATVLYVGRADPYKNLTGLIEAFARLVEPGDLAARLRIVGSRDPRYPQAERRARERGLADRVSWTGYVTDEELLGAYQQADVLVSASRYEGFGLSQLEAMACGTPVICSNAGSLPEVVGQAALLHEPDDIEGFAQDMRRVLTDPHLAQDLRRRGLQQARKFTWTQTAQRTIALYRRAAGK